MSRDPAEAAIDAATVSATVTLPLVAFNALVMQAQGDQEQVSVSDDAAATFARDGGIEAVFSTFAGVLNVKNYDSGVDDPNQTEHEALQDEACNILRAAGITNDDDVPLDGPTIHAMRERLRKLEAVADAARLVMRLGKREASPTVFAELEIALRDLPGEVAF